MQGDPAGRGRAIALLVLTALLWSTSGLFIKLLDASPLAIFGARGMVAGVVFLVWMRRTPWRLTPWLAAGALGYMGAQFFFILSLQLTTAANAIFLQYTAPITVLALSIWLLGERPRRIDGITMLLIFAGMLLFFGQELKLSRGFYGNLAAVLGGVALAVMIVSSRAARQGHPARIFLLGSLLSAVIGLPAVLAEAWSPRAAAIMVYLGVFQTGLASALYAVAIRRVRALEANLILTLEPVLNPLWVFLVIGETPGPLALAGGAVVLGAITARAAAGSRRPDL